MPYDAPDYSVVLWDAAGKPYWKTASGAKTYIPPITAAQYQDDLKLKAWATSQGATYTPGANGAPGNLTNTSVPGGDFFHHRGEWDSQSGKYDTNFDWGNALSLGVGGLIAAPVVAGALAGSALPAVAGGGAATTSAAVPAALAATGGAGGAAAGGAGVAGIGSWLTSPTASLIGTGLQVAGGIWGANKAADTSAEAARIQAESYDKALAQEKQELDYQHGLDSYKQNQYADYLSRLDPYARTGQTANNTLSRFMGQPPSAQTPLGARQTGAPPQMTAAQSAAQFVPNAVAGNPALNNVPQGPGPYAQGQPPVLLEAPNGTQKTVPADQAPYYISKGAKPVQQTGAM